MKSYKIVRHYFRGTDTIVIKRGLTLEEAQAHCQDEETNSKTCTEAVNVEHTRIHGPWFDGYYQEE